MSKKSVPLVQELPDPPMITAEMCRQIFEEGTAARVEMARRVRAIEDITPEDWQIRTTTRKPELMTIAMPHTAEATEGQPVFNNLAEELRHKTYAAETAHQLRIAALAKTEWRNAEQLMRKASEGREVFIDLTVREPEVRAIIKKYAEEQKLEVKEAECVLTIIWDVKKYASLNEVIKREKLRRG